MGNSRYLRRGRLNTVDNDKINERSLEIVKDIFENTNKWLNFAEAKNGALIGVNGLFLFKSIDYLFEVINGELKVSIVLVGFIVAVFMLAILIALKSFFPNNSIHVDKTGISEVVDNNSVNAERILIFYGDICKYQNSKLYLQDIYKYYLEINVRLEDLKKIELDFAKEIIINSQITSYKYRLFKRALGLNFFAILVFCILLIMA